MRKLLADAQHLVRLAGLFLVGVLVFLVARGLFTPKGFGDYGHYRPGALDDNRAHELSYAGRDACAECHDDIVAARRDSKHEQVGCESCHGPLAAHADDPGGEAPLRPEGDATCLACHLDTASRPASFPQVEPRDHADGTPCLECHSPHHPEV